MTTQVNEFSIDIPMSSPVPPMAPAVDYVMDNGYGATAASVMSPAGMGDDVAIAVGDKAETDSALDASRITVYAGNISPVSYGDTDPIACFDVVFTVGIMSDGASKTYQVVKRIGIDKCKIAAQASAGAPVSVVESTAPKHKVGDKVKVKASAQDAYGEPGTIEEVDGDKYTVKFKSYTSKGVKASSFVTESQQTKPVKSDLEIFRRLAGLG